MKRSSLFKRILVVDATVLVLSATVVTKLFTAVPESSAAVMSHEQFQCDSLLVCDILNLDEPFNPFESRLDTMPGGCVRLDVDRTISHGREFNDSNYLHLDAARAIGIDPIDCEADAWNVKRPVVSVVSCRDYYVDRLAHSLPYLVPEAEHLLRDIGRSFRDSLAARGGGDYRIKVTSVLRTNSSIKRLRRRNRNAVGRSAHLYGTTFDISYSNFICDSVTTPRTVEDMKHLLAEILRTYRDEGRCYVKHERKQACFHITAIGFNAQDALSND